jgi:deoxyribodipyrimidine photo-lyase
VTGGAARAGARRAIVLFTRDLRVHDQPALAAAARGTEVVPLFVLDEALLCERAPNRLAFLLDSLRDLQASLRSRGADLVLRRGDPVAEAMRVAAETGADALFVSRDASPYAQRRQARLSRECARERIAFVEEEAVTAISADALARADRDHYRRFTPYWRRWSAVGPAASCDVPERLALPPSVHRGRLPELADLTSLRPGRPFAAGGEQEGRRRLDDWLSLGLSKYDEARDAIAEDGTSRLSAYLHFGCISPRDVLARARASGAAAEAFVRQLCWRDFYLQLLAANPQTVVEDLYTRENEWNDDEQAFERWRSGLTGIPIVDAAMRQLHQEGWMHNRLRLIVASFLTKTLGQDWRRGARVFSDLLVDADVANNIGNWQWVAGTGVDTRPNRVFNPIRQAKRLDPAGTFVRRYVPELAGVEGPAVHEPWRAPLARVAPDYPRPIVEYAARP